MPDINTSARSVIANSQIAFGTSGARGLVEDFTNEVCTAFTVAFINSLQTGYSFDRVAIGIDRRPSSPRMAGAIAGAIERIGLKPVYYGVLPTPALALKAITDGVPAIMVTGSHIPFDRNGIKFYRPDGEISKDDEQLILASESPLPDVYVNLPRVSDTAAMEYASRYTGLFPADALSGMRIGLYEHSAAGRDISRQIFEQLGASVVSLGRTDTFVPIDTEAVAEEDRTRGRQWAEKHQLDAIFSTDGDGDRPLLADETGDWLRGDILGLLCARELGIEALAVPVSCNTAIELCGAFTAVARTKIGSPYVIEAMATLSQKYGSVAGFEANGGFLTGSDILSGTHCLNHLPTRDAILPALVLLAAAKRNGKPLSSLLTELPPRYTASDRLKDFATEKSNALIANWKSNPDALKRDLAMPAGIRTIDFTDGLRATLDNDQVVHLRPSGNAPELRCYCEAESHLSVQALLTECLRALATAAASNAD
ncbi:phosphomannomutase [Marinobacter sp. C2H3]|uniref:phosphomannomutase n=1 Tax=Marinobacter sp. C2H3 TaxID=3119003 RepID=UPI00300EB63E